MSGGKSDPNYSLKTFSTYIRALARSINDQYGTDPSQIISDIRTNVKAPNPRPKCDLARIERSLRRAWATEDFLRDTYDGKPLKHRIGGLPWLPAQAYYSMQSALDAALEAYGTPVDTHAKALNCFGSVLRTKIPVYGFAVACEGAPSAWTFTGFKHQPQPTTALKVGTTPPEWCNQIGLALRTTREVDAEDAIEQWKVAQNKQRVPKTVRETLVGRRKMTTIMHLFYRLRLRSNYGDIDLFLNEPGRETELTHFAGAYVYCTIFMLAALEALIERRIGIRALEQIAARFPAMGAGPTNDIAARWGWTPAP